MQLEGGRAAGVSYRDDSEASFGSWAGEMQAGLSEGRNQSSHIKRTARKTQGEITSWCFSHKNRQPVPVELEVSAGQHSQVRELETAFLQTQ